jgi:ADP-ribose pyrophosphatase YjhB (NUDIX family)
MVGVGGVVIDDGRTLLIRRGSAPLKGEWSIPGGLLEVGETIEQGVARELAEETGLEVRVTELIEVFERIFPAPPSADGTPGDPARPQYHFVILDYLCEVRWSSEAELPTFNLRPATLAVIRKAFEKHLRG